MKRPAETSGAAGQVAVLIAYLLGLDETTALHLALALGFVPLLVTRLVDAGGIRGVVHKLWRGRESR